MPGRTITLALSVLLASLAARAADPAPPSLAVPPDAALNEPAASPLARPAATAPDPAQFRAGAAALAARYQPLDYDPDLRAEQLADGVEPAFQYVRDHVRFETYPGVLRGAKGAYTTRAANAADRSLLLARLLEKKGVATRFARGTLPPDEAARLIDRLFAPAPARGAARPDAELSAQASDFLRRLQARAGRDYAAVINALRADLPRSTPAAADLIAEVTPHVWVQAKVGQKWVDLDTAFPDSVPGKAWCKAERTVARLPDDLHQRVVIRVVAERLERGALKSQTVLEVTRPASELLESEVFLLHAPAAPMSAAGKALAGAPDSWRPVLWIDGETTEGKPIAFGGGGAGAKKGGVLGTFDALPGGEDDAAQADAAAPQTGPAFVAEYLEFEIRFPGGRREVTRRVLYDRGSVAWRKATPPAADALAPLERDDKGPLAARAVHGVCFSAGRRDLAAYAAAVTALSDALHAEANTPAASAPGKLPETNDQPQAAEKPQGDTAPDKETAPDPAPAPDPETALAARLWSMSLQNLATVFWADHAFVPALNTDPAVRFYTDSPRILLFSLSVTPNADGTLFVRSIIDLRRDKVRGVARDPAGAAAVARGKIWYGCLEGALEHEVGAQYAAASPDDESTLFSTSATLDDKGVVTLRPAEALAGPWERLAARPETAARMESALKAGETLVVPARVIEDGEGAGEPAWWAVSDAGDVRAVGGRDLNVIEARVPRLPSSGALSGGPGGVHSANMRAYERLYGRGVRRPPRPRPPRGGGGNEYLTLLQNVSVPLSEFVGSTTGRVIIVGVGTGTAILTALNLFDD